jgi:DNA repair exonuclease SbcCD nuclease subunit
MKIVFAADTHLHPHAWASRPDIHGDAYRAFEQIVGCCVQEKVAALILGGDIFDMSPPADAVQCFLAGLERLKQNNIRVYAVQGQHGRSDTPWTAIDPHVVHLAGQPVRDLQNVCFTGFDQSTPVDLKRNLESLDPNVNLLVLHQLCRGTVPDIEGQQTWDLDPEWVPESVKLVLMGDYHIMWTHTNSKGTQFIYPGSTAVQAIDESDQKHFLVLVVEGPGQFRLERRDLVGRRYIKLVIQVAETLEAALTNVQQAPAGTVVHIKYNTDLPGLEESFREINKDVFFMFRPLPKQLVSSEAQLDMTKLKQISLEGCLGMALDREKEPLAHDLTLRLLKAEDPRAALAEAREQFLNPVPVAQAAVPESGDVQR